MKTSTPETRRQRLPRLQCSLCGKSEDALRLGRWGRYRICASCHEHQLSTSIGPEEPDSDLLSMIRRVDSFFRCGAVVLRLLLYAALYHLGQRTDFGPHILTGFLLGDSVTWLASAWMERRFHSLAITLEALLYTGAVALWLHLSGGFQIPDEPIGKALVGLSFLGTFSAKGTWQAWRMLHGRSPLS